MSGSVPRRWAVALAVLRRLPQGPLSQMTGWLASRRVPVRLRPTIIGGFVRATGIDLSEATGTIEDYPSVSACFTRSLRPGVRSWPEAEGVPASPVDGVVGACGRIRKGTLLQAKGIEYQVAELLAAGPSEEAPQEGPDPNGLDPHDSDMRVRRRMPEGTADGGTADGRDEGGMADGLGAEQGLEGVGGDPRWEGGHFMTLYLSPRHYHRIHAPVSGTLVRSVEVEGRLLPVNEPAVASIPRLFSTNARRVLELEMADGVPVALVAVGAFNVGQIPLMSGVEPGAEIRRGQEVGRFDLGSTVVLLLGRGAGEVPRAPGVEAGNPIRLGQALLAEAIHRASR